MGSVVQLTRRRPVARAARPARSAEQREADDWRALIVLATVFGCTAVAMAIAVVVAGSSSWAEATPLIVCVVVIALTKVVFADVLFFIMLRSDSRSEARAVAAAARAQAAGLVIRRAPARPRIRPLKGAGARPPMPGQGTIRLAPPPRKPINR